MKSLNRALNAIFTPVAAKAADTQRKAREEAKRLAVEHGVKIDKDRAYNDFHVYPPKSLDDAADPFSGDHYAADWHEVLVMVRTYAGVAA